MSGSSTLRDAVNSTAVLVILAGVISACGAPSSPSGLASLGAPEAATSPTAARSTPVSSAPSTSQGPEPTFDPVNFPAGATIDNPWFPLIPGTTFTARGTKDGEPAIDVFAVIDRTKVIEGVTARVVEDRLTLSKVLHEKTTDYYAQDSAGNVWYLGEDTAELDKNGNVVNRDGSWLAGVDGAIPGIYMEANPTIGHQYRQEFYKGQAEDHFAVLSLSESLSVPFGSFDNVLLTKEWTPLEPDVLDNKFYVRGLGQIREVAVKGPVEELSLVSVTRP